MQTDECLDHQVAFSRFSHIWDPQQSFPIVLQVHLHRGSKLRPVPAECQRFAWKSEESYLLGATGKENRWPNHQAWCWWVSQEEMYLSVCLMSFNAQSKSLPHSYSVCKWIHSICGSGLQVLDVTFPTNMRQSSWTTTNTEEPAATGHHHEILGRVRSKCVILLYLSNVYIIINQLGRIGLWRPVRIHIWAHGPPCYEAKYMHGNKPYCCITEMETVDTLCLDFLVIVFMRFYLHLEILSSGTWSLKCTLEVISSFIVYGLSISYLSYLLSNYESTKRKKKSFICEISKVWIFQSIFCYSPVSRRTCWLSMSLQTGTFKYVRVTFIYCHSNKLCHMEFRTETGILN